MATPLETYKNQYESSTERQNNLKWQNATINDVANKYGFRFDKDYANQQAETIAAGQRNAYNAQSRENQTMNDQTVRQINADLKEGVIGTEDNFFQQYIQQRQEQANRGVNAGISADQDTRLGMNQQKVLAGLYRDTANNRSKEMDRFNNEVQRIAEALAQVEKEKLSTAEKLYQELLGQGYNLLGTERSWFNTLDQQRYGKYQDEIDLWYKEQDRLAAERAAAAQRAAQQAAAQQQSALQAALNQYKQQQAKQATAQTPIQKYTNTPAQAAVARRIAMPSTSYATKYAFTNSATNKTKTVANNPSLSPYAKMKMMYGEY